MNIKDLSDLVNIRSYLYNANNNSNIIGATDRKKVNETIKKIDLNLISCLLSEDFLNDLTADYDVARQDVLITTPSEKQQKNIEKNPDAPIDNALSVEEFGGVKVTKSTDNKRPSFKTSGKKTTKKPTQNALKKVGKAASKQDV